MHLDTLIVQKSGCAKVIFENTPAYIDSKLDVQSGKLEMRANNAHPYTLVADKNLIIRPGASLTLLPDSLGNPFHTATGGHVVDSNTTTDTAACAGLAILGPGAITAYTSLNGQPVVSSPTIRLQDSAAAHLTFLSGTATRDINLAADLRVRTLNLAFIRPILGPYNLRVRDSITGFTSASNGCVRTTGTGSLIIEGIGPGGKQNVLFPIFNTAYNPVTVQNTGALDAFGARVSSSLLQHGDSGAAVASGAVSRTWFVGEDVPGGSIASLKVQWSGGSTDELTGFTRTACRLAHRKTTGWWDAGPVMAATGSSPYTLTRSGLTSFSPFAVVSNLSVLGGLVIAAQPASGAVCAGASATLSVSAQNATAYQWRKDGQPIAGATSSSLTLNPALPGAAGAYDVVVTGSSGVVATSEAATLTINKNVWTGAAGTAWSNAANWNVCGVPGAASFVEIPAGAPAMPTLSSSTSVWQINSAGNVSVAQGATLDVLGQ